jgi:two-component system, chemotaxis family, chemotaxis protein CheY
MRCLIVEDNGLARDMLSLFLTEYAEIETAANGLDAVARFREGLAAQSPFQLVLLDIVMPGMDGQQALKMMRQAEKANGVAAERKAVIIMTTALQSQENMVDALWDGDCTDYLVKPVTRTDLLRMLNRYRLI